MNIMERALDKINQAGLALLDTLTPEETYSAIVEQAKHLVDAEYGSILLSISDKLQPVYASDPFFATLKVRKGGTIEQAFKEKKFIVNNITTDTKVDPAIRRMGIQSVILIPLAYRGDAIGILSVLSLKKEHFSQKEIDMLRVFGSMASFAIKKAQLYNETRKALEIRDMFISMASHELRTPLTSISGYIQLLHGKLAGRRDAVGKWIEALYEENKRMMHLVKEILEVNRLKAGQLQFRWQECDLNNVIKEGIKEVSKSYGGRIINYKNTLKTEAMIVGDSERLTQVILNILDNALKYSSNISPVDITLTRKLNLFTISVTDYGKGIDESDLSSIFDGHHKGDGGEEGFGWGLFFVDNIIRQHRGSIDVKSKLKKGTTMEIHLPKAKYY